LLSNLGSQIPEVRFEPARKRKLGECKEQQKKGRKRRWFPSRCGPQELNVASKVHTHGFLICLDLVKTCAGEKSGLKIGDIFVKFGHMNKKNFQGLEHLSNFLRANANQTIEVVVLRKMNEGKQQSKGPEKFRKIVLFLTPSNSGVLGLVMQIWPLPKLKAKV